jgi:hypothetical protein
MLVSRLWAHGNIRGGQANILSQSALQEEFFKGSRHAAQADLSSPKNDEKVPSGASLWYRGTQGLEPGFSTPD